MRIKFINKLILEEKIDYISWSQYKPEKILEKSILLINADDAWSSGYTGEDVKICVIDSGLITNPWENIIKICLFGRMR